jgi:two-component system OmpR family sensor kinase
MTMMLATPTAPTSSATAPRPRNSTSKAPWASAWAVSAAGLVDDMLRLARLDQQPGQHAEPVDVSALVTECAERAEITDPERAWHTDIASGLSSTGDEELLRRAVNNLLANVRAHTPGDTTATLTAAQCNGSITIEVSDDGPGVPPDQLARIFDRFYRSGRGCPGPASGSPSSTRSPRPTTARPRPA